MSTTDAATEARKGSKRFVRPAELPDFNLTPRNLALLAYTAKYGLISSDDLACLDGGSAQKAKRELRRLWAHGYIIRPTAQLKTVAVTGPQPMACGISNKGARLLREHGHHVDVDVDWSENARRVGIAFIDHSVARARFMGSLEVMARDREDIELLDASAVIRNAPAKTRAAKQPLKWIAKIPDQGGREVPASVIADDLFALIFNDGTASYFLVEIDRGQMPVRRHGQSAEELMEGKQRIRTHYRHKLATYYHGWRQRRHVEQLGVEQVRILTVTTSERRIATMIDALEEVTAGKGSELFLFIDEETLRLSSPLDAVWTTGKGNRAKLTD